MKRLESYSHVRGFNYQPSYGSHGLETWGFGFDLDTIDLELGRGKQHFPNINTIRLFADIADEFSDGHLRWTSRNRPSGWPWTWGPPGWLSGWSVSLPGKSWANTPLTTPR